MQLQSDVFSEVVLTPWVGDAEGVQGGLAEPESFPAFARYGMFGRIADRAYPQPVLVHEYLAGTFLYGGICSNHFGHVAGEYVHRLWALQRQEYRDLPVLFVCNANQVPVADVLYELAALFGATRDRIRLVKTTVRVERLVIAESGKQLGVQAHPAYIPLLADLPVNREPPAPGLPQRIAILRGHLPGGCLAGEDTLERYLAAQGYTPVRPETHPIERQLQILRNASQVILSEGSAGHLYDLLPVTEARVALLKRRYFSDALDLTIGPKVRSLAVLNDAAIVQTSATSGEFWPPGRALAFAPVEDIVGFLKRSGFLPADAPVPDVDYYEAVKGFLMRSAPESSRRATSPNTVTRELLGALAYAFDRLRETQAELLCLKAQDPGRPQWECVELVERSLRFHPDNAHALALLAHVQRRPTGATASRG